jgi:hypothetical protein
MTRDISAIINNLQTLGSTVAFFDVLQKNHVHRSMHSR